MERALVRHGSTDRSGERFCGRTDRPLSAVGERESAAAARQLWSPRWSAVVSSSALRARQTAEAIAAQLGVAVELDDRLCEIDFGDAEGRTFDEVAARWPELADRLLTGALIDWPNGETASVFAGRVRAAWTALAADERDVVVVAHGGTFRVWLDDIGGSAGPIAPGGVVRIADRPWRVTATWTPEP